VITIISLPKGMFYSWMQGGLNLSLEEVVLNSEHKLIIPKNWINFVTLDEKKMKVFGLIPYEYSPGKKLDKEMRDALIASFFLPYDGNYEFIYFLAMRDKDKLAYDVIRKKLLALGKDSYELRGRRYSKCSLNGWACSKVENVSDIKGVVSFYLPEPRLLFSAPKKMINFIENQIQIELINKKE